MYKVSDEVKRLCYNIGSNSFVNYEISFSDIGLTIDNDTIHSETVEIEQAICDEEEFQLGGCIASCLTFTVSEILANQLKGQRCSVNIHIVDKDMNDLCNAIPMGKYVVDSAVTTDAQDCKSVTAYDDMYSADIDVADWYNAYFPVVSIEQIPSTDEDGNVTTTTKYIYGTVILKRFREDLLRHLNIPFESQALDNDNMTVTKTMTPSTGSLKGRDLLKQICVIHGGFGIMDRFGKFKVLNLQGNALFPEETLYPEEDLFPQEDYTYIGDMNENEKTPHAEYKTATTEEYTCMPITCLKICNDETENGCVIGNDTTNPYLITGNNLLNGKSSSELNTIGGNIMKCISNLEYRPTEITSQGLPYSDVGDYFLLRKKDDNVSTFAFKRKLKGIQNLSDDYSAKGSEYRSNEVDVNTEIMQLQAKTLKIEKSVDGVSIALENLDENTSSRFEQTADSIQMEVTNAKQREASISQAVSAQGAEIVLKVDSYGKLVQVALTSDADSGAVFNVDADNINLSATDVINLLAGNTINLTSKNITIKSNNFSVDGNGNVGIKDTLQVGNGVEILAGDTYDSDGMKVNSVKSSLRLMKELIDISTKGYMRLSASQGIYINGGDAIYGIKRGTVTISTQANETVSQWVSCIFSADELPVVVATPKTAVPDKVSIGVSNVSKMGFNINVYRESTATMTINWIAIQ